MTAVSVLIPLWLVWTAGVLIPGPNFLAVTHVAAAHGRRAGLLTAQGVALGAIFWALAGLFGLKIVFAAFPWAWTFIKFAGAVYLIATGVSMWRRAVPLDAGLQLRAAGAFRIGLLTNLSNAKTAAFAASLFAVAVPQGAPQWITVAAFGLIVGTAWGWYSLCGIMASHHRVTASYKRFRTVLKRGAGAVFVGFGATLALDSREF